jgi:hypothetical protein
MGYGYKKGLLALGNPRHLKENRVFITEDEESTREERDEGKKMARMVLRFPLTNPKPLGRSLQ